MLFAWVLIYGVIAALSLSSFPPPGYPSSWLMDQLDPSIFRPSIQPLSGLLARMLAEIPVSTATFRLSLLNLLWGGLALVIFHRFVYLLPAPNVEAGPSVRERTAHLATAYLAFAPGFWWNASRPGPAMTGFLLVLIVTGLVLHCHRQPDGRTGWLTAAIAGCAAWETLGAALCAPFFLFALFAVQRRRFKFLPWCGFISSGGAVGFLLGWGMAWWANPELGAWAILSAWRTTMLRQFPHTGWLAIGTVAVGALCLSLWVRLRPRKRIRVRTRLIQALIVLGLLALLWLPSVTSELFQPVDGQWIMPWATLAIAFGVSSVFFLSKRRPSTSKQREQASTKLAPSALFMLLMAMLLASAVGRYPRMSARAASGFDPIWQAMLEEVRIGDWIVSDGSLDAPLGLIAREQQTKPLFIHPGLTGHAPYRARLASQLDDPGDRSLAGVSPSALIADHLSGRSPSPHRVYFLGYPEMIVQSGRSLRPRRARYETLPDDAPLASDEWMREQETFWSDTAPALDRLSVRHDTTGRTALALRRYLGRIANDLGVVMEHRGETVHAARCYERALAFDPDNVSAWINQQVLDTGEVSDGALTSRLRRDCGPDLMARLARDHGFIHNRRALYWLSDLCGLRDFDDLPADRVKAMARAYIANEPREALRMAVDMTEQFPASRFAWMLMGALAFETGDDAAWERALDQMNRRDERWAPLLMALGQRAMEEQDYERAATLLDEVHLLWPLNVRLLETLIQLDLHVRDAATLDRHLRELLGMDPWNPWGNFALGLRYMRGREPDLAEAALRRAIGGRPFPMAYNNLAWLLYERGNWTDALFYARRAVELDPYAYAHWDTLGAILMALEAWDAAGEALHAALALNPDDEGVNARLKAWAEQGR